MSGHNVAHTTTNENCEQWRTLLITVHCLLFTIS